MFRSEFWIKHLMILFVRLLLVRRRRNHWKKFLQRRAQKVWERFMRMNTCFKFIIMINRNKNWILRR